VLLKCTECVISDELITLISSGEKLNPTRGPMSTDMSRVKFVPNWKAWIWTCTSFRSSWEANSCWNREVKFVKELEVFSIWKATSIGYTHWQAEFDESGRTIMLVVQHPGSGASPRGGGRFVFTGVDSTFEGGGGDGAVVGGHGPSTRAGGEAVGTKEAGGSSAEEWEVVGGDPDCNDGTIAGGDGGSGSTEAEEGGDETAEAGTEYTGRTRVLKDTGRKATAGAKKGGVAEIADKCIARSLWVESKWEEEWSGEATRDCDSDEKVVAE
jgi:hypothetical protein